MIKAIDGFWNTLHDLNVFSVVILSNGGNGSNVQRQVIEWMNEWITLFKEGDAITYYSFLTYDPKKLI